MPFSVESSAATCRVRYSYPDPVESLWSVMVTSQTAGGRSRVASARGWMKEVCGEEESVVMDRGGEEGERGGRREGERGGEGEGKGRGGTGKEGGGQVRRARG